MKLRTWIALVVLVWLFFTFGSVDPTPLVGKATALFDQVKPETKPARDPDAEIEVFFCPRDGCGGILTKEIQNSELVDCAFFDLELESIIEALQEKDARVIVDNRNMAEEVEFAKQDTSSQLMHNKFCIFDNERVWTGSFNPTHRGNERNNNNVLLIRSPSLATLYTKEFEELWQGIYGKGPRIKNPEVTVGTTLLETYFCPEDYCANKVAEIINTAQTSVHFLTFSFTHSKVAEALEGRHNAGVKVKGVFEKSQNSKYSQFSALEKAGLLVRIDGNKANMHHKVFIIDGEKVITGSFNPSKNADTRNDENVLVIHDKDLAGKYLEEFEMVWEEADKE